MPPKRVKFEWLRRRELLVLTIVGFAAALGLGLVLLFRDVQTNQYQMRTGNWTCVQIEVEFQRFLNTLARYSFNDPDVSYEDLTRRLDILWSRVLLTRQGPATKALRDDEMFVQVVGDLDHALRQIEPFTQELSKGDIDAYRSIETTLRPFQAQLHQLVQHLIMQSDTMAREGQLAVRYREITGAFMGVVVVGLVTVLLLVRERRRSDRLARAEREARERAEADSHAKSTLLDLLSREIKARDPHARAHLVDLMDSVLDMARLQSGTLTIDAAPIDLSRLALACLGVIEPRAVERRVVVLRRLDPALPPLRSDERLLRQILVGLMAAAVERVSEDGRIEVTTALDSDGRLLVEVRDNGDAVPAEGMAHTVHPSSNDADILGTGTGPGLAMVIANGLAQALGATLSIAGTPGAGTAARLSLPVAPALSRQRGKRDRAVA